MREIRHLQGCINDLISRVALSAVRGEEPQRIVGTLLNVLVRRLDLDFVAARLSGNSPTASSEMLSTASTAHGGPGASTVPSQISEWLNKASSSHLFEALNPFGPGRISVVPFCLGLQGRLGTLVAASARTDFPTEIEMLVLRIAVDQAAIALHEVLQGELASELVAMTRLHEFSSRVEVLTELQAVLEEALTATIEIQQADFGNVQIYNPESQALEIAAQRGFAAEAAGFRAVQSTPLFNRRGEVLGMISTHFKRPHRPSERELRYTDLYARRAAEMIERKRADDDRAKLVARIDRLTHAARIMGMDVLTTSIAHEINQPLGGVVSNSNACIRWLNREVPDLKEARAAAELIIRDANRANDVIRSIRAFSKRAPMDKRLLDVNAIIREVVAMVDEQLRSSRVETTLALSDSAMFVPGDRIQLQQVLVNLVVNAIDALRPLTDRPRRMRITSRKDADNRVTVCVEDKGIGPGEQDVDRLFDAFFSTKPEGMGLGLSISRNIIQAHGGELNAARNELHGLTMSFSLPSGDQMS
jgi:signal transduction histidine kinase